LRSRQTYIYSGRLISLPIVCGLSFVWSRRIILIRNVYLERFVDLPDVIPLAAPLIKSEKPLDFCCFSTGTGPFPDQAAFKRQMCISR
jgi:hypothetical protein